MAGDLIASRLVHELLNGCCKFLLNRSFICIAIDLKIGFQIEYEVGKGKYVILESLYPNLGVLRFYTRNSKNEL